MYTLSQLNTQISFTCVNVEYIDHSCHADFQSWSSYNFEDAFIFTFKEISYKFNIDKTIDWKLYVWLIF